MTHLVFEYPLAWLWGLPLAAAAILLLVRSLRRSGWSWRAVAVLAGLRAAVLAALVCLAARPVLVRSDEDEKKSDRVVLLVDRSESMSLRHSGQSRYEEALQLARNFLLPALKAAGLHAQALLFAEDAAPADGAEIAAAQPEGKQTNLARAIVRGMALSDRPPRAVIALTDGAATEDADNARAISALAEQQVPFFGIGCGRESGTQVISLERVIAPRFAAVKEEFQVAARLRATAGQESLAFDLLLLRDGQLAQKKTVSIGPSACAWQESFSVTENEEKFYRYTIQVVPPQNPAIKCPSTTSSAMVRVEAEKDFRVLFVQGALTWDYKFIRLALAGDRTVKLSGLSRTANGSSFFQSSEDEKDLAGGFPETSEELARFRVVVLSNLRPSDLSPAQQDLLAAFCGQYGGGVLMIGGPDTFNGTWQGSRLEQLLPVRFAAGGGFASRSRPFRLQITRTALSNPAFQIDDRDQRAAWANLPTFSQYAVVDSVKPGAEVWAVGPGAGGGDSGGSESGVPLMACQRYGGGLSAVICVQNFWRWRLAKPSDPQQFDRFWQQLFKHLAEGSRELVSIAVPDQRMQPGGRIRLTVERRPDARAAQAAAQNYRVLVKDEKDQQVADQGVELRAGAAAEIAFPAERPGLYAASVVDAAECVIASRSLEVSDMSAEFNNTARDMESLRQWAALSGGLAVRSEDCSDAGKLIAEIKGQTDRRGVSQRWPVGVNGWVLALLAGCLCVEWTLRKRWELT
jgi:Mg-chelatase subunit ChlD